MNPTTAPVEKRPPKASFRDALRRLDLTVEARRYGLALAEFVNREDGSTYVGQRHIEAMFGIAEHDQTASLAELVDAGLLTVDEQPGPRRSIVKRVATRYLAPGSQTVVLGDGRRVEPEHAERLAVLRTEGKKARPRHRGRPPIEGFEPSADDCGEPAAAAHPQPAPMASKTAPQCAPTISAPVASPPVVSAPPVSAPVASAPDSGALASVSAPATGALDSAVSAPAAGALDRLVPLETAVSAPGAGAETKEPNGGCAAGGSTPPTPPPAGGTAATGVDAIGALGGVGLAPAAGAPLSSPPIAERIAAGDGWQVFRSARGRWSDDMALILRDGILDGLREQLWECGVEAGPDHRGGLDGRGYGLDGRGDDELIAAVHRLLDGGWWPDLVLEAVRAQPPFPKTVKHPAGLVRARLAQLPDRPEDYRPKPGVEFDTADRLAEFDAVEREWWKLATFVLGRRWPRPTEESGRVDCGLHVEADELSWVVNSGGWCDEMAESEDYVDPAVLGPYGDFAEAPANAIRALSEFYREHDRRWTAGTVSTVAAFIAAAVEAFGPDGVEADDELQPWPKPYAIPSMSPGVGMLRDGSTFGIGDSVRHETFGVGQVCSLEGERDKIVVEVRFPGEAEPRSFLLAWAPLEAAAAGVEHQPAPASTVETPPPAPAPSGRLEDLIDEW